MKKKGKKSPLTRKDSVHEESMEVCSKNMLMTSKDMNEYFDQNTGLKDQQGQQNF